MERRQIESKRALFYLQYSIINLMRIKYKLMDFYIEKTAANSTCINIFQKFENNQVVIQKNLM